MNTLTDGGMAGALRERYHGSFGTIREYMQEFKAPKYFEGRRLWVRTMRAKGIKRPLLLEWRDMPIKEKRLWEVDAKVQAITEMDEQP